MISGPQTVEAPYFNAKSRKGSVPHLTMGAKHHLPFANMEVASSQAMFDDMMQSFSKSPNLQAAATRPATLGYHSLVLNGLSSTDSQTTAEPWTAVVVVAAAEKKKKKKKKGIAQQQYNVM